MRLTVISANTALLASLAHLPCQDCHSAAPPWQQFSFTIQPPTCLILMITTDRYQLPHTKIYRTNPRLEETKWRQNWTVAFPEKRRLKLFMANNFTQRWDLRWSAIISGCNVLFFFSCGPRLLSKSTEEPDAGEGGRRRANWVQAQDVPLGRGVMAEGHRPSQRKQQVMLMLHIPPELWTSLFFFYFSGSFFRGKHSYFFNRYLIWRPFLCWFRLKIVTENLYKLPLKTLLRRIPGGTCGSTSRRADRAVVNGLWLLYLQIFRGGRWLRKFKRANRVFLTSAGTKSFLRNAVVHIGLVFFCLPPPTDRNVCFCEITLARRRVWPQRADVGHAWWVVFVCLSEWSESLAQPSGCR